MNLRSHMRAAIVAAVTQAGIAGAAPLSLDANRNLLQQNLVVASAADINNPYFRVPATTWSGAAGLIINTNHLDTLGFVTTCSATLVSSRVLLTAAHCIDSRNLNRVRVRFGSASSAAGGTFTQYEASHFWVNPDWDGSVGGNDLAALYLDRDAAASFDRYGIYRGSDEFGQIHTKVGFGSTGEGTGGTNSAIGGRSKRAGQNIYEASGDQLFSDAGNDVLLYDFDSGLAQNDVFGALGLSQRGVYRRLSDDVLFAGIPAGGNPANFQLVEANSSPGDSGGGTFIGSLLAGITSFGVTGAIIDGACGPGHIDSDSSRFPGADSQSTPLSAACTNSSFGELAGDTRVSSYASLIDTLMQTPGMFSLVPEPGMLTLFGLGFAGLIGTRRRKS